jgi:COP9 signalosome complex subunit 6
MVTEIGALLGTQSGRDITIVNSFELTFASPSTDADVEMGEGSPGSTRRAGPLETLDTNFLQTRKDQCTPLLYFTDSH